MRPRGFAWTWGVSLLLLAGLLPGCTTPSAPPPQPGYPDIFMPTAYGLPDGLRLATGNDTVGKGWLRHEPNGTAPLMASNPGYIRFPPEAQAANPPVTYAEILVRTDKPADVIFVTAAIMESEGEAAKAGAAKPPEGRMGPCGVGGGAAAKLVLGRVLVGVAATTENGREAFKPEAPVNQLVAALAQTLKERTGAALTCSQDAAPGPPATPPDA